MELISLAQQLGQTLRDAHLTICAAESCTGGLFLSTLTDISGSSAYVLGGVVTYSNEAKEQLVHVQPETLIAHGAVSEPTAHEMALGVQKLIGADIAISITGIAGPGGGTPEKPVGLVYIGLAYNDTVQVVRHVWSGDRIDNKVQSVVAALQLVLNILSE